MSVTSRILCIVTDPRTQYFYGNFPLDTLSQAIPNSESVEHGLKEDTLSEVQKATVVVVGCAAVDITSQAKAPMKPDQKSTYPGKVTLSLGGVARNIAEATHRVLSGSNGAGAATLLVAPIGDDEFGKLISTMTQSLGMRTDGLVSVEGQQSAICNLFLDSHGDLQIGTSDMDLPHACEADQVGMTSLEYSWFTI